MRALFMWITISMIAVPLSSFASHAPGHVLADKIGLPIVAGEVKRVDKEGGKITLKHDAIPNLGMDAMTMVFRVQEPALLEKVKAGDKVRFRADHLKGAFTVTEITKAP